MLLSEQIQQDLIAAMKAKDTVALSTLRMLKTAVMKAETSGGERREVGEEELMKIVKKEVKQRTDSIKQFEEGGRGDLAEGEKAELAVLEKYLPEMMSDDQVREIVKQVIGEVGASGAGDLGKVMGIAMQKVGGQADGGVVRKVAQEELA